jgi:aminopeptidase N
VSHYELGFHLGRFSQEIAGKACIRFYAKACVSVFYLDFGCAPNNQGSMRVHYLHMPGMAQWAALDDRLEIRLDNPLMEGQEYEVEVAYSGKPRDGLILSENAFGEPTLFADNWPNRAHLWFPCADHPSDKATVTYKVTYPSGYSLIANGQLLVDSLLNEGLRYAEYATLTPLPTKVMVIGLAHFAISPPCMVGQVEVTSWVYDALSLQGFADYAPACQILEWYVGQLGPYPYEKLANVQSTTLYGGMENASCIFYHEGSVSGHGGLEALIAHEIAHQWFGNSATESHWPHIWLSEGFATYFTHLYLAETYGRDTLMNRMRLDRDKVARFHHRYQAPVIDSRQTELTRLLNPNSYEKGSWFLHMLRHRLGDSLFWNSMRTYHSQYMHANASTWDLLKVVNHLSGADYGPFFRQWLERPGHPVLKVTWKANKKGEMEVTVRQTQKELFDFELELRALGPSNAAIVPVHIGQRKTVAVLQAGAPIVGLEVDPDVHLLFENASARP